MVHILAEDGGKPHPYVCSWQPRSQATIHLICFPCAGGKASFFSAWEKDLPASIKISALSWSAAENRSETDGTSSQGIFANYSTLVATMAEAIRPQLDRSFALYGHSFGGLVAYDVACFLRHHYNLEPMGIFLAGTAAPQVWGDVVSSYENEEGRIESLLSSLRANIADLCEDVEQRMQMEAALKRDLAILSTYVYQVVAPFRCPLTVFGGWQDHVWRYATLPPWETSTSGAFLLRMFSGDHFFPFTHTTMLIEMIVKQLLSVSSRI